MERRDKINYYLDIAEAVTGRGTCLRRNFGAVIVKNDTIISTGYVGAPRGRANCNELHYCTREKLQVPRGGQLLLRAGWMPGMPQYIRYIVPEVGKIRRGEAPPEKTRE